MGNLNKAKKARKASYDKKVRGPTYQVGDLVWPYKPINKIGLSTKVLPKWHSLFRIKEMTTPPNALLQWVHNGKISETSVHMNRLKPRTSRWQKLTKGLKLAKLSETELSTNELICSDNECNTPLRRRRRRNAPPSDYILSTASEKSSEWVQNGSYQDFMVAKEPKWLLVQNISDPERSHTE